MDPTHGTGIHIAVSWWRTAENFENKISHRDTEFEGISVFYSLTVTFFEIRSVCSFKGPVHLMQLLPCP